jgi:Tfp pilus assembly protein PilF/TolB-like protein
MSSIIEGYNYDIFISYRQKDNKGDRWVSEFVDALKTELESTFKEEISVYFDINPHDGLLETHDVDASLKDKLKCLVFIPIISRTYCDPKSFAWEHEFKAFVGQASQDQFGLKVKLPNGNVTNRVLPIRIHDLDADDIKLCESALEGVLRGVEFIYKEPGVNKSLTANDDEKKNINNTKYRIQINKTANAIREIISGLRTQTGDLGKEIIQQKELSQKVIKEERKEILEKPIKLPKSKLQLGIIIIAVILVIALILAYPIIFKRNTLERLRSSGERISVVVFPFQNMTNDTIWNVWQKGIQENLITYLSNFSSELKVRQTETVNSLIQSKNLTNNASITPSTAKTISQKLEANVFIYGSIQKAGTKLRLSAKLIETNTMEVLRSFEIDTAFKEEIIFDIVDILKRKVADFLIISEIRKELDPVMATMLTTNSPKAYRYYANGLKSFSRWDFSTAIDWYLKAIAVDSNLQQAYLDLSVVYSNLGMMDQAKDWCLKAYKKRNMMPVRQQIWSDYYYSNFFETPYESLKYLKQLQEMDDKMNLHMGFAVAYRSLGLHDKALVEFKKYLQEINNDINPELQRWALDYANLGQEYHYAGQYRKEKKLYREAEKYFPDEPQIIYRQAILAVAQNDLKNADYYIEKYKSSLKEEESLSKVEIPFLMAIIYSEGNSLDKAEEYYRQALSLEPDNPTILNYLAWFLIDKDRNISEGMGMIDKALKLSTDDYSFLDTKGWGLYKQGKYKEALEILEKSDSLKPGYDHELYLHLEEAKKAVAGQKN